MNTSKNPLLSRTIWIQIIAFISAFQPVVQEWLASNPVAIVGVFNAINILVRFVTQGKISVLGTVKTGAVNLLAIGLGLAALFTAGTLTSCADYPLRGSAYYRDSGTGAKAGVHFIPGGPPLPFFRADIRDEDGVVVGAVDLQSGK